MARTVNFEDCLQKELKNPKFKEEYDRMEPRYQIIQAILDARNEYNLTQKDLAELTGIGQADISRIEHGNGNPSLNTLYRLAKGLGMKLKVSFEKDPYAEHPLKRIAVAEG